VSDRGTPDYRAASIALWFATGVSVFRKAGVDVEVIGRCAKLADAIYQAVAIRGARVGELVSAVDSVRAGGSILDDLPVAAEVTRREKPPMSND
jgi:hypothetical protein